MFHVKHDIFRGIHVLDGAVFVGGDEDIVSRWTVLGRISTSTIFEPSCEAADTSKVATAFKGKDSPRCAHLSNSLASPNLNGRVALLISSMERQLHAGNLPLAVWLFGYF